VCLCWARVSLLFLHSRSAGTRYAWGSAAIIGSFVVASVAWIIFVGWEMWVERRQKEVVRARNRFFRCGC
jgi:hypothetical protein